MRKLVVSTGNKHKLEEISKILEDLDIEILSKDQVGFGDLEVVEDGNTLYDNSYLKAKALSDRVEYMTLADDSGLFVDALDGNPGVHSSRYAGEDGNDEKNNEKLLRELDNIEYENRTARFKTTMVLIMEDKEVIEVEGKCEGHIVSETRGDAGFGYDPLFIPEGYNETFAELGSDIKNKISHRSKALERLRLELEKRFK